MGGGGFTQPEQSARARSQNATPEPISARRNRLAQAGAIKVF
jgi:hypothetical protein